MCFWFDIRASSSQIPGLSRCRSWPCLEQKWADSRRLTRTWGRTPSWSSASLTPRGVTPLTSRGWRVKPLSPWTRWGDKDIHIVSLIALPCHVVCVWVFPNTPISSLTHGHTADIRTWAHMEWDGWTDTISCKGICRETDMRLEAGPGEFKHRQGHWRVGTSGVFSRTVARGTKKKKHYLSQLYSVQFAVKCLVARLQDQ